MQNPIFLTVFALLLAGPSRCGSAHPTQDAGPTGQAGHAVPSNPHPTPDDDAGTVTPPPRPTKSPQCGGLAGRACAGLGRCVDDPSDSCDPKQGGADCGGVCVCDAKAKCRAGQSWNASPDHCSCEGVPTTPSDDAGTAQNEPPETCGKATCNAGEVCCNASCGVCTAKGQGCTKQLCVDDPPAGHVFCGGIAAFRCPGSGECTDDPNDGCDPSRGGADCGGVCRCSAKPSSPCAAGTKWNPSPKVCACEGAGSTAPGQQRCGSTICPSGQSCCNASCGVCVPPGGACTQQICN